MAQCGFRTFLSCIVVVAFINPFSGGAVFTQDQESKVVTFIENLLQCRGIVGATVAVVRNGNSWTRGFGVADREANVEVNTSTLFGIGSVTKMFSSALLSLFINETGKYTWQTPVVDVLGKDFKLKDNYVTQHVTIKDLLLHRSGVLMTNLPIYGGFPDELTRAEYVRRLKYIEMGFPSRDKFEYNNMVYAITGRLVEVMAGGDTTWEDLLEARLLKPLGMTRTRVLGKTVWPGQGGMAKAYVQADREIQLSDPKVYGLSPLEAAGAIAASADDMAKWLLVLLNNGKTPEGVQVLSNTRLGEMMTAGIAYAGSSLRPPLYPVSFETYAYGYGWMVGSYRGYRAYFHSGGLHAFITWLGLIPDFKLGVFISTNGPGNRNASLFYRILFYYIVDIIILGQTGSSEQPWLNMTTSCQFPAPWNPPKVTNNPSTQSPVDEGKPFENTKKYVGSYGSYAFGDVQITLNGTGNLTATYGRLQGHLYQLKNSDDDTVALMEASGSLTFLSRPSPGVVNYVKFDFKGGDPNSEGRFQEVHISSVALGEVVPIVFKRGETFSSLSAEH